MRVGACAKKTAESGRDPSGRERVAGDVFEEADDGARIVVAPDLSAVSATDLLI